MQTNKFLSRFMQAGTRLVILASMLFMALIGSVIPAAAAPPLALVSVTVGAQTGTLTAGSAGSVTFSASVLRSATSPTTFTLSVTGLPVGASVLSQVPANPLNFAGGNNPRVVTLTIQINTTVAAGSYNFTVQASGIGPDPTGTGTLVVAPAVQATPTITFGPAPTASFPGSNFAVSATTDSDGALTYSFVSGPCSLVDANAGTFSPTGVGDCVVQANTASTAGFLAGSAQQTVSITAATTPGVFDLYAVTGSASLPGATVTVWGYNTTSSPVTQPGGPTLVVNQGDIVMVTLHNQLAESTALLFQGQDMIPDVTGAAPGGTKDYSFVASRPGTYLYEAGLLTNAQHQVALGLYGVLIVRPATAGQAYDSASSAFNNEAVLLLSDIDPLLNNSANPASFDMRNYAPKYFLINGKVYPNTDPIPTLAGNRVLLRYINAGLLPYSMSLLGMRQTAIAMDGSPFTYGRTVVAETIAPGQTADMIATVPAGAADGNRFVLYDANLLLHNNKTTNSLVGGFGGMMTFLTVTGTPPTGDTTGPATSGVSLTATAVSATVSDAASGGSNVSAAEFFVDTIGVNGTGVSMSGAFGAVSVNVSGVFAPALSGTHTVYVHGQDAAGNWGSVTSAVITVDNAGPTVSALSLSPSATNGTVSVNVSANADDTASGGSNIAAAEYAIDGGAGVALAVSPAGVQIAGLSGVIAAATVNGLNEGTHVVSVRAQDSQGNWGAFVGTNLAVDKTGPVTSNVLAAPNPNNGALPFNSSVPAVRVTASFADSATTISAGEGFIDALGASGTGFIFLPSDGQFNSSSENGYSDIPLTTVNTLSSGNHTLYICGKDVAGNWGACATTVLVIDKTAPAFVSIMAVDANPTTAASVQFLVTFSEAMNGIASANFALVTGGSLTGAAITSVTGSGATRTVTVSTGSGGGTLGLNMVSATGITDLAGNALPTTGLPFVGPVYTVSSLNQFYFSTFGNTNPPGVGGTADDADIYTWNGSAYSRVFDASVAGLAGNANMDGYDRVDATHFYMSFSADTTVPGLGTVQDEDVIYYNNGTWSVYFDGTANGLGTSGNLDLDAINISGGILYFSTFGNTNPPGVGGTADDADIYSWNGSTYARVWDATVNGLPGAANVDALVGVDATHFYMSFSADTTVPGLGTVQDEDVIYYNNGTWSVYFDGTANGLGTSGNLDIDAFDLP
jgi:hypothetical protein